MSVETLLAHYGLAAVFVGAGLEGEAVVVAGGVLAHHGAFPLAAAMAAAAAGSFVADQAWFFAGRRFHDHRWVRRAHAKPAFARAIGFFHRYPIGFIFAFRFVYGFRVVSPIAVGSTDVSTRLFVIVNLISATVWGVAFSALGYVSGRAVERLIGRLRPDTPALLMIAGVVLLLIGAIVAVRRWRAA